MYSYDHFTASLINTKINNSYIKENNYFYNDGYHNNSKIYYENFKNIQFSDFLKKYVIVSVILLLIKYNIVYFEIIIIFE